MNKNLEISLLSDDELGAVSGGGKTNSETAAFSAFYEGFHSTSGEAAGIMFQASMSAAQAAAGR
jgi:hypothetical protein